MAKETASEIAKKHGLKSLQEVAALTDTSTQTLNNWRQNKFRLFMAVVLGAAEIKKAQN